MTQYTRALPHHLIGHLQGDKSFVTIHTRMLAHTRTDFIIIKLYLIEFLDMSSKTSSTHPAVGFPQVD